MARETRAFGAHHAEVGGYLLGLWGLPGPVVEAISLHHSPSRAATKAFGCLAAVHVAEAWASPDRTQALDRAYLGELGLLDRIEHWQEVLQNTGQSTNQQ